MGLSASMWTSVSGLLTHGQKMNVVGNNIANVSTLGFKSQRMDFNDYLYRGIGTTSGTSQIGAGAGVYAILGESPGPASPFVLAEPVVAPAVAQDSAAVGVDGKTLIIQPKLTWFEGHVVVIR